MAGYQRILVPVDFSDCSAQVVAEGRRLAAQSGAEVVLLHVVALPADLDPDLEVRPDPETPAVSADDYVDDAARRQLARYDVQLEGDDLPIKRLVARGPVVDTILATADRIEADLIVVGTHGRKGFYRWVLGSVAEAVVRKSTRPVVTIRSQHRPECEARSCSACQSGGTGAEELLRAELEG